MARLTGIKIISILCLFLATGQVQGHIEYQSCGGLNNYFCVPRIMCSIQLGYKSLVSGNLGCPSTAVCCPQKSILIRVDIAVPEPVNPSCGRINAKGATFPISDLEYMAQENEFPWMVALLDATHKNYVAGGALIAFHVVISVRGKIDNMNPEQLLVRAGEWDFKVQTEQYHHVDVEVKQIVRHPDFDFDNGANNVALLFLKRSLKADMHINPICLPERPKNFDYSRCIFTGWGKKSFEDYTHMNILKKIELPVVQSSTCQNAINQYLPYKFVLHNSLMCAGGENDKDSCTDDGGSPLACPIQGQPGRYELAGLVNFGLHCGLPGVPGVYVNVANLRQWIEKETAEGPSPDDIQEIPLKPFNTHGWNLNEANKSLAYGNGNGQNEIIGQHYPVNNSPSQPDNADEWVVQEPNQNDAFGDGNAQNNFVNWYPQQNGASAQENNQRDQYSGNSENWDTSTMGYEYN